MKVLKSILASALVCASIFGANAQDAPKAQVSWYGFIRNYFTYDSRESVAGKEDFFYFMPKDVNENADGVDLNAVGSFRFAALTSRIGMDVKGYEIDGYKIAAKIEADFYDGISGNTGVAGYRLRQAFVTVAKDGRSWKVGQAWHPMAADMPDIFSLETGSPFQPFSRTPLASFDYAVSDHITLNSAAIWQMQYCSVGPNGASADYIKYSGIPELYAGVTVKGDDNLFKVGGSMVSIKPRNYATNLLLDQVKVNDRLTTFNAFLYDTYKAGNLTVKEKLTVANDGSHLNMFGGYGVSKINDDLSQEYSATLGLSDWLTLNYKGDDHWSYVFFVGLYKNFGTSKDIVGDSWARNNANKIASMVRVQPEVVYTLGKIQFGLEYMWTSVQYGKADKRMVAVDDLHWVSNNRVQCMVKYNF